MVGGKLLRMTGPDSSSFRTVVTEQQARLLTDPRSKAFFKPFLARECSASQAARAVGCPLTTMHYRIKTFLKAGLLSVVREEKRKGRAIKVYRSVHNAYFIPFSLTPYATLEERLEAQAAPLFANLLGAYADAIRQSGRYGHFVFRQDGAFNTSDRLPELTLAGLPVVYSDMVTTLRKEDALSLGAELRDLFERGDRLPTSDDGTRDYLLLVALMPLKEALEV